MYVDNGEVTKHAGGRPLLFKSPEELQKRIDEYFAYCDERVRTVTTKSGDVYEEPWPRPKTISGLAVYLDCDRKTIVNYGAKDEFFPTIARARRICEAWTEEQLFEGNDRGTKFSLINNYDWKEKQETALTGPNGQPLSLGLDITIDYGDKKADSMINVSPVVDKLTARSDSDE